MMNLMIVESPHKADTIQKFLGKDEYMVTSSRGHIRDLNEKKLSIDIEHGFKPEYVIPDDKKRLVTELRKLAKGADRVLLASDEDREGEAISWHLAETLGLDMSKTSRIAFHEITKPAILEAIKNPREIDMNLVDAQQARRVLDRLVGFELSPVLWRKIQPKLSAGRVQSVALRLIVDREREIMGFKREPFYRVEAVFHPAGASKSVKLKAVLDKRFSSLEDARKFLGDSIGANYRIYSIDKKEGTRSPAAPFTTSTLQQEAARKLHFPVSTTMRIAQALYERGLITYMRTDSVTLSALAIGTAKEFIVNNFGPQYSKSRQYRTKVRGAQEAHEAIRPTYIANADIAGTPQEKKLYSLIWKRTVASQMADAKVLRTGISISQDKRSEKYSLEAQEVLFDGFLKLYMEGSDDDAPEDAEEMVVPQLNGGDAMEALKVTAECRFTAPPSRYTDGTLVKKLEEMEIGRPSTWATVVDTLTKARGYVVKGDREGTAVQVTKLVLDGQAIKESTEKEVLGAEKGKLLPQEVGMIVSDYLVKNFPEIMDYGFTAGVDDKFDKIAHGKLKWGNVISDFYTPFHGRINEAIADRNYNHVARELGTAHDGKVVSARYGQYGPYVQKGEGEDRKFANLAPGQLIETITLEEALRLFELPRTVGTLEGVDIIATKGKYGPYLKYGDKNISLPRKADPMTVSEEECIALIRQVSEKPQKEVIKSFADGSIQVLNGMYGPYIKSGGKNYKIPKTTDALTLTEQDCKDIISAGGTTAHRRGRVYRKK